MKVRILLTIAASSVAISAHALDLDDYRVVDLSHTYDENTLYWPTSPSRFEKEELAYGKTEAGYFYSSFSVCFPEHGGTHLDAPLHFSERGYATDEIPVENLIAKAVVIDVREMTQSDRNYRLSADDVRRFEDRHGSIESGTIVLMRTGWSKHWPNALEYLGDDTPGKADNLQFPGFGEDAARMLVEERGAAVLGIDTASIDYGQSDDFIVHRIAAAGSVAGLENLKSLDELPASGFLVMALPMKIGGGSGGPVRVVALVSTKEN